MKKKILLLVTSVLVAMLVLGCPNESPEVEVEPGLDTSVWALANGTWVDSNTPEDLAIIDATTIFAVKDSDTVYNLTIDGYIKGTISGTTADNKSGTIYLTVTDNAVPASATPVKSVAIYISSSELSYIDFYSDAAGTVAISGRTSVSRKITNYADEVKFPAATYTRAATTNPVVDTETIVFTAGVAGTATTPGTPGTVKIGAAAATKIYAGYRSSTTGSLVYLVTDMGVVRFTVNTVATISEIKSYVPAGADSTTVNGPYFKQ